MTPDRTRVGLPKILSVAALVLVLSTAGWASDDIPRRHDGKPDLTGSYDVATLTPLTRPARYGDKLTLTDEEAKAIAERWANNFAKDYEPSDPDREAPPKGGVGIYVPEFTGAAGKVGGYNAGFVDIGESNFKLDGKWRTSIVVDPPSGQLPAMTPAAVEKAKAAAVFYHENTGDAWWLDLNLDVGPYDDPELRPPAERCLLGFGSTAGPPMLPVMYNNLKRIVQTDTHLMILAEMNHDARIIRIESDHESDNVRRWLGDSVGRWEGDTLVVVTKNFNDSPSFSRGSSEMTVTERFSRIDGETLRYQFTVDDPSTWETPFSGEYPWPASQNRPFEYACHEGNYSLGGILRGARLLEEEKMAQQGSSDD